MKAKITVHPRFTIGEIDPKLYGSFVEHLGRCVYGGIYEPTHPTADEEGFRGDVLELVKKLGVPIVRYPGGNFVSNYHWEDGIGPKDKRPVRPDLAWRSIETNQVGIDEFQSWAKKADTEVMMAVNLGNRGVEDALNCLEYCNLDTDTTYAALRRQNGFEKPFDIKYWCLGNEMDGPWQTGYKSAEDYGRLAHEVGKQMKLMDPSVKLIACGSSNSRMATFIDWERAVLTAAYNEIDYISLHSYYAKVTNSGNYLASCLDMDRFIKAVGAVCDSVKAKKKSKKDILLSFDEWNVWYSHPSDTKHEWAEAPALLENVYNFEDALEVGMLLMTLQNNCDRVKMACMAQLVNVIAPIMTENGGKAWAQTIFYPYYYASLYGRGTTLRTVIDCPTYETDLFGQVPYLEASVIDGEQGRVVFAVNRSLDEEMELELDGTVFEHIELYHDELTAVNDKDNSRVTPTVREVGEKVILKPHSWNMIRLK